MAVYGYIRVSSLEQAEPNRSSLDDQATTITHAAGMKKQAVAQIFSDPGVSGSVALDRRPGGKLLLAALSPGDTLIVAKMDRLFRSTADALNTVDRFKQQRIALVLCDMGSEPVTENGVGRLFLTMMAAVAEFERSRIAERTAEGRKAKGARGGLMGGSAPYGFRVEGKGRDAVLVADEGEQAVVELVRYLQGSGLSNQQIVSRLAADGITSRSGKPFAWNQVARILGRNAG